MVISIALALNAVFMQKKMLKFIELPGQISSFAFR